MLSREITSAPQGVPRGAGLPRGPCLSPGPAALQGDGVLLGPWGGGETSSQLCPGVGVPTGAPGVGGSPAQGEQGLSVTSSQLGALQEGCP